MSLDWLHGPYRPSSIEPCFDLQNNVTEKWPTLSAGEFTPRTMMQAADIAHGHVQEKEAMKGAHARQMGALREAHDVEAQSLREELSQLRLKAMDTLTSSTGTDEAAQEAARARWGLYKLNSVDP